MELRLARKHFIQFQYSGSFFSEETSVEIVERDPSKIEVPPGAYCFSFYDQIVGTIIESIGDKEIAVNSAQLDKSPTYYYGGKVYTVEELKKKFPNEQTLITNVEINSCKRTIKCRNGNWRFFKDDDVLIEEE